jgi:hypothetical protein
MKKLKQSQALVAHTYNPSSAGGRDLEDHGSSSAPGKYFMSPISKIPNTKWADGVTQIEECLLSKCEAQNSNPSTAKSKVTKKNIFFKKIIIYLETQNLWRLRVGRQAERGKVV